jgi:hypothetical protein
MNSKYRLAPFDVWEVEGDPTVESAGSQQCRVKDVWSISGCENNDRLLTFEAIHLDQNLIKSLLALVMTTAKAGTTLATDSIYFVNKNESRCVLLGLLK